MSNRNPSRYVKEGYRDYYREGDPDERNPYLHKTGWGADIHARYWREGWDKHAAEVALGVDVPPGTMTPAQHQTTVRMCEDLWSHLNQFGDELDEFEPVYQALNTWMMESEG